MSVLLTVVGAAVLYGLYIAGWLLYVRYIKKHGGSKSITVNDDGSLNLKKGGFIWRVVRLNYLLDYFFEEYENKYKDSSLWDERANLCPIGARFLYGLTLFPLVVLPLGLLVAGIIRVATLLFFAANFLYNVCGNIIDWIKKKIKPAKQTVRQPINYTAGAYHDIDDELTPPLTRYQRLVRWVADVLERIGNFFADPLPTGPKLFNGWSFYDENMPWSALLGLLALGAYFAEAVMSMAAIVLTWFLYGTTILYGWETLFISPPLAMAVIVLLWWMGSKLGDDSPIGQFLSAWWQAKHDNFCPPVHFVK